MVDVVEAHAIAGVVVAGVMLGGEIRQVNVGPVEVKPVDLRFTLRVRTFRYDRRTRDWRRATPEEQDAEAAKAYARLDGVTWAAAEQAARLVLGNGALPGWLAFMDHILPSEYIETHGSPSPSGGYILSPHRVEAFTARCRLHAEQLLDVAKNQRAVAAIAAAILENGTLDGEQVQGLMVAAATPPKSKRTATIQAGEQQATERIVRHLLRDLKIDLDG